ncbi:hypothetical protein BJV82DRAFT_633938 [Fennellomyces sp. T-0311]|nr:hypothetical protein BJV82DRAFT_633938 [Fennellomyces sp. T-0311]
MPNAVYDLITLEDPLPPFDRELWKEYMTSVLSADAWRTADCPRLIFNNPNQPEGVEDYVTRMVTRILLVYSECIHNEEKPCDLTESETTYCYYTIWPFLRLASAAVSGLKCDFSVGETGLRAMSDVRYNADGKIYIASSKLEILLLEASGAYGTNDLSRHTFDHIKGAFGCHGMLLKILTTYHGGDSSLMGDIRVFFVHASAKDQYIRLWSMRSVNEGEFISFERVMKVKVDPDHENVSGIHDVIEFFVHAKILLQRSCDALQALKRSHEEYVYKSKEYKEKHIPLNKLLKAKPVKPNKADHLKNIGELDPSSSLF